MCRCFVGCLGQARKRCRSNRWCCGLRNYASDVRPTDPLAAGVESPSQTLLPGDCRTKILKKKISAVRLSRVVIGTTRKMSNFFYIFRRRKIYWTSKMVVFDVKIHFPFDFSWLLRPVLKKRSIPPTEPHNNWRDIHLLLPKNV